MPRRSSRRLSGASIDEAGSAGEIPCRTDNVALKEMEHHDSPDTDEDTLDLSSNPNTTDSDYVAGSDDGDYDIGKKVLDLNKAPDMYVSDFDDYDDDHFYAKRKKSSSKKRKVNEGNRKKKQGDRVEDPEALGGGNTVAADTNVPEFGSLEGISGFQYVDPLEMKRRERLNKNGELKPYLMWEIWEEEHKRWIDDNFSKDFDMDQQNEAANDTCEAPSELIMPLLRYQKEWLVWALNQEESEIKGGILADEMGMGKTIQAIALVLAKREVRQAISEADGPSSLLSSSSTLPDMKCTLVICPKSAATQWRDEIERFTTPGSVKVLIYHGSQRGKSLRLFYGYDFVITTYNTIEADYRRNAMPPKQRCEWCGKPFSQQKMAFHLKYFCGPNAVRTEKQSKQVRKGKSSSLKMSKQKIESANNDSNDDESDNENGVYRKTGKTSKSMKRPRKASLEDNLPNVEVDLRKSVLHSVKWERIILDEAHSIKSRSTNTAKAVLALESTYKWALSGTPLQNRVGELYTLVRFLRVVPYSYYFCKDCDCKTLDYSKNDCPNCSHKPVRHFCWWNRNVSNPMQVRGTSMEGKRAMTLLKHKILKGILLRRTKMGRASDLALPPRIVTLRRDTLDIKEEDYYRSLYNESQAQFNTYVQQGTVMNNYAHIFDLLTRLRQAVDHPYLVVYSSTNALRNGTMTDDNCCQEPCGICHEEVEDQLVTACGHVFCKSCLLEYGSALGQLSCPTCSKPLTVDFASKSDAVNQKPNTMLKGFKRSSILNRVKLDDFQTSTKIDALREEIRNMVERDGSAKGIVFSQFTSFLDLIKYSLQKSGINCVQLEGSMTIEARDAAIARFNDDPDCRIFLISLKAGGVALNLTVASHVFLMDPWWNPATERQAMDRIHRIGQYKPIRIVRFIIENTIEERILRLQEKKELVFEGTVGGSSDALNKLTEGDLRFLFVT